MRFIIVISGLLSVFFASEVWSHDSYKNPEIILISKITYEGEPVELILLLPSRDDNINNWSLFLGANTPIMHGLLGPSAKIQFVSSEELLAGTFNAVLVLYDDADIPISVMTSSVEVIFKKNYPEWIGYIVTFISTILLFSTSLVIKRKFKENKEIERFKRELRLKITEMINVTHKNDTITFLKWLENPNNEAILGLYSDHLELTKLSLLAREFEEGVIDLNNFKKRLKENEIVQKM